MDWAVILKIMSKKAKTKGKASNEGVKPKESVKPPLKKDVEDNDNTPDFGGIPNRDLKKNLGCG